MTKQYINQYTLLQQQLNYHFKQTDFLIQALTHRSVGAQNNERLEFLGDALLSHVVAEILYQKYPHAKEGQLTRLRACLVKGETLADIARQLDLGQYVQLGAGELKSGGWRRDSILADGVEALIGAVYLDAGMEACQQLIQHLWWQRIDELSHEDAFKDAKTQLQEKLQAEGKNLPVYDIILTTGQAHEQEFHVRCQIEGMAETIEAKGNSRRKAEQKAAAKMLKLLTI